MALRIKQIDLEQCLSFGSLADLAEGAPECFYFLGGITLEDGEATIRFKPSLAQCEILWERVEPFVLEWAKALINGEASDV